MRALHEYPDFRDMGSRLSRFLLVLPAASASTIMPAVTRRPRIQSFPPPMTSGLVEIAPDERRGRSGRTSAF